MSRPFSISVPLRVGPAISVGPDSVYSALCGDLAVGTVTVRRDKDLQTTHIEAETLNQFRILSYNARIEAALAAISAILEARIAAEAEDILLEANAACEVPHDEE